MVIDSDDMSDLYEQWMYSAPSTCKGQVTQIHMHETFPH